MKERRKLERFQLSLPAEIVVESADQKKEVFNLTTRDICAGGAFFRTMHPLPEGTQVQIKLSVPSNSLKKITGTHGHVKISGTVKRSEPSGMAICFHKKYEIMPVRG